jgi:RHS repeat-associated protein
LGGPVASTSTTYNADDQSQAETSDATGNTVATGGRSYTYNSWLKLVSMNGGQVTLAYNGLGQLVSKTSGGITTQYLIDDLSPTGYPQVVAELVNGQAVRTYTYGLERISELQTVNNAPTASFYQYDGRGTVRTLTDASGAVTDSYEYDAFGNLISKTGTTPNAYLYRGERYDAAVGLYYLRARWYNPVTGRFMTRDPYQGSVYDPASLHRYNYARSNPANFIDPSGRLSAGEYGQLALNTLKNAYVLTAYQFVQNCTIYAIASSVQLVGDNAGFHVDDLWTNFKACGATITVSNFGRAFLANTALLGLGEGLGALGAWLDGAEQGAGLEPALDCGLCFAAGTPVHTDHGSVPIERIKVGDKVWAHNEETGANELRTVTAIAPQHRDHLLELRIEGEKNALRATPVHPFYARRNPSEVAHWIDAGDLVAGEQIETQDGRWVAVQSVTPIKGLSVVYNFTVEEDHDYFVGDKGLLVHNAGPSPVYFLPPYLLPGSVTADNPGGVYTYRTTADYGEDSDALANEMGLPSLPAGYQNHKISWDPQTNEMTAQAVEASAHSGPGALGHSGGARDFSQASGTQYGTDAGRAEAARRNAALPCK